MKPSELELLRSEVGTLRDLLAVHEEQALSQFEVVRALNRKLVESTAFLQELYRAMPSILIVCDAATAIVSANEATIKILGYTERELVGMPLAKLVSGDHPALESLRSGGVVRTEMTLIAKSGTQIAVLMSAAVSEAPPAPGRWERTFVLVALDIRDRKRLELELRQAQKLESIGRLAAGVAHEINTPMQYVSDSIHFLRDAIPELLASIAPGADDPDGLRTAIPEAIECSIDGVQRIATIVRSMKEFAHPDSKLPVETDLNRAIYSTLMIARSEYKLVADVETEFGELPAVSCYLGDLNQAVLNIIINAAHAIADRVGDTGQRGTIRVVTRCEGDHVVIEIGDTGCGIPVAVRDQIFDPFFTTKDVGRGTGQGLSIARQVIVERHGGSLTFETEVGVGTTFTIRLAIDGNRDVRHAG